METAHSLDSSQSVLLSGLHNIIAFIIITLLTQKKKKTQSSFVSLQSKSSLKRVEWSHGIV